MPQQLNEETISFIRRLLSEGHQPDRIKLVVDADYKMNITEEEIEAIAAASAPPDMPTAAGLSEEHVILRHKLDSITEEITTRLGDVIEGTQQLKLETNATKTGFDSLKTQIERMDKSILTLTDKVNSTRSALYDEIPPSIVARVWRRSFVINAFGFTGFYAWLHPAPFVGVYQNRILPLYQTYLADFINSLMS